MAITRITSIKKDIKSKIEYITGFNFEMSIAERRKLDETRITTCLECALKVADLQFTAYQKHFHKTSGVLAYHVIQSFKPDEIDASTSHEIGIKLAKLLTECRHQCVVTTHTEKNHIHNHIIFNAVSFMDGAKFHMDAVKYKYVAVRKISDDLCKEYGLSIIEEPKGKGMNYKVWLDKKVV